MSLFEHVGGWITSTDDPALQRLFATAAHRHAWHAELWQHRTPTIPGAEEISPDTGIGRALDGREGDDARAGAYADALAEMLTGLRALRERIDDDLDPATVRVIDLVASDAQAAAAALRVHLVSDTT